jgi:hypothetical protein
MSNIIDQLHTEHANMAKLLNALDRQVTIFDAGGTPDYDIARAVSQVRNLTFAVAFDMDQSTPPGSANRLRADRRAPRLVDPETTSPADSRSPKPRRGCPALYCPGFSRGFSLTANTALPAVGVRPARHHM